MTSITQTGDPVHRAATRPQRRFSSSAAWVADHELLLLALLAPILLFPMLAPPLAGLALACVPLLWLARWRARGRLTVPTPLDWPIVILLAMVAVAVWLSVVPALAAEKGAGIILGVAVYYAIVNTVRRESSLWFAAGLLVAVGALLALIGLFGTSWWTGGKTLPLRPIYEALPRLITFIPRSRTGGIHPNEIGGTLALMLPPTLGVWLALRRTPRLQRLLGVPPTLILIVATFIALLILLIQSRGAWLGVLGVFVAGAVMRRRWLAWATLALTLIVCAALAAEVLPRLDADALLRPSEILPSDLARIVMDMDNLTRPDWEGYSPNWLNRLEIWRNALLTLSDYPLSGVGLAAWPQVSAANYVYQVSGAQFVLNEMTHAHNIYLEAAVNFGVPGLIAFLALLLGYFASVGHSLRRLSAEHRWLLLGLAGGVLAHLLHGLVDAIAFGAKPGALLWAMLGLSVAVMRWSTHDGGQSTDWCGYSVHGAADERRTTEDGRWPSSVLVIAAAMALLGAITLPTSWGSGLRLNRAALWLDHARLYPGLSPQERNAQIEQVLPELQHLASSLDAPGLRPGAAARRLGMAYLSLGQTDKAQMAFRGDPQAAAYLFSQGMMRMGEPDQTQAILAFYRLASEIDPMTDLIYCRLLGGLSGEEAERAVFISPEPTTPPSPEVLARCHEVLGQKFIEQNQWDQALTEFQRAVKLAPNSAAYQYKLGWALYRTGGDLAQAAQALQRAAELDPKDMWPCLMLSQLRREQGLLEEAIAWADAAAERAPDEPLPLVYRAQALIEAGEYTQAEAALQQALANNPRLGAAHFWLGVIQWHNGETDQAIAHYERAVQLEPNNVAFWLELGDAYQAQGRRAEAIAAYEAVLRLDRENVHAQERLAALRQ